MQKSTTITSAIPAKKQVSQRHTLYAARPAAGFPAPGDDLVEKSLDLNELLVSNPTSTFFVRVAGDSMEGAGIFDGDYLVIDRSIEPRKGRIVVAAVFGELVVKRLSQAGNQLALVSENEDYEPILIQDQEDVYIWGVAVGSARSFL